MRALGTLAALITLVAPAAAQQAAPTPSDSSLVGALRLVSEGQGDSARSLVRSRLAGLAPTDSLYAEALFVAGAVANNADSALAYYRRVSIEYSQSDWAPLALLRIGQLAFASGDFATAARSIDRVLSDYPFTPIRAAAYFWAGRIRIEQGKLADACTMLQSAVDSAGVDVELANRARFYLQRCTQAALDSARRDSTAGGAAPAPTTQPAPAANATPPAASKAATGPTYAVQVAAVSSTAAADQVMQHLRTAGYAPRIVRETGGLLKIRVGHFTARADADRLQAELKRKMGGSPFVVEEPQ